MNKKEVRVDFSILSNLGLSPNQYVIAYCIHHKLKDTFYEVIGSYKEECTKEDIFTLIEKGYLNNGNKENIYEISFDKCSIIGIFTDLKEEPKELTDEEFFVAFLGKFPAGITSGGIYVKSSKRDVQTKLKKFEKEYSEYDRDTILKAAENYVHRYSLSNYKYMKVAHYFILKNNESVLASECEAILNGDGADSSNSNGIFSSENV